MNNNVTETSMFGTEKIYKILLRLAPPVMFAQLIQALCDLSGAAHHHGTCGWNRCRRQHADGAATADLPQCVK